MTENTRIYNKFEYHVEDMDCDVCLYYDTKKRRCKLKRCCCEKEMLDAIKHGRIARKRGWFKCHP